MSTKKKESKSPKAAKSPKAKKEKKAPAKVKGRRVEIEVEVGLSDREKVKRGERACELLKQRDALILERKSVADEYKSRIVGVDGEAKKLLNEFTTGREKKTVNALEVKNFAKQTVEHHFQGKCVASRPMTIADRQTELPLGEPPAPAPVARAARQSAPAAQAPGEDKACVAVPGKAIPKGRQPVPSDGMGDDDGFKDPAIRDLHREATSRSDSGNALNGAAIEPHAAA